MQNDGPHELYDKLIQVMEVDDLHIPIAYIKFFKHRETLPDTISAFDTPGENLMCCQALRHAQQNHPVYLTIRNIGCIAAAISLGLVDAHQDTPLSPAKRQYTDLMRHQFKGDDDFIPPSPKQFTNGDVYACQTTGHSAYCLFGPSDTGRFYSKALARKAISAMVAIQPPVMQGVFLYSNQYRENELKPDVVVMDVRPVELTKIMQGYQYMQGEPLQAWMNPLRSVDSDLIARPYLTQKINVSSYCLGSRMVARFSANRMGIGLPMSAFKLLVKGLELSQRGYPFHRYPGASLDIP